MEGRVDRKMRGRGPSAALCAALLIAAALLLPGGCSGTALDRRFASQVDELLFDLAVTNPERPGDVIDFATRASCRLNLASRAAGDALAARLEEDDPWYGKLLLVYLLVLREDLRGLDAAIEGIEDGHTLPRMRAGLAYCAARFLGWTERETAVDVAGWQPDLAAWKAARDRIARKGMRAWRRALVRDRVLRGDGEGGDELLRDSTWLPFVLEPEDVPFLGDLLGRGGERCDRALLVTLDRLLLRSFLPASGEGAAVQQGVAAFRSWYEEHGAESPDRWMVEAFQEAGYTLPGFYCQAAVPHLTPVLLDTSSRGVLLRHHALRALNRICGFQVDRRIIFMEETDRKAAGEAFMKWYQALAERLKYR